MDYEIYTSLQGTRGSDGEVNLTLMATRDSPPIRLSDFIGGKGQIYDGYATVTLKFIITPSNDEGSVVLLFDNGLKEILRPEYVRIEHRENREKEIEEVPLITGKFLSLSSSKRWQPDKYEITGSSWWR